MDILTHIASGAAVASTIAPLTRKSLQKKLLVVLSGAAGAFLPDLDVITRWSMFDATIGRWLNLRESGREIFFGNHWYSHHNFTHSIACALLVSLTALWVGYWIKKPAAGGLRGYLREDLVYSVSIFLGFMAHLMGDLPTPASTWGGIKLFWPMDTPVGGSGLIWWWNNYDIFLILLICCAVNLALLLIAGKAARDGYRKYLPAAVFAVALTAVLYQIGHRPVSFVYPQRGQGRNLEADSLAVQRNILGDRVFEIMQRYEKELKRFTKP